MLLRLLLSFAVAVFSLPPDDGLVDHRIASSIGATSLDGTWTVKDSDAGSFSLDAKVPGDLITDLHRAGIIGDPYYEVNWLRDSELWANRAWTYSRTFQVSDAVVDGSATQLLVFDGVKMGANIYVNGEFIGAVEDQFLRYVFPVANFPSKEATLEVVFPVSMDIDGRWMACTGGWDWAPYTNTSIFQERTNMTAKTFSKGIWKSVYLLEVPRASVAITHLTPHTTYQGEYPVGPIPEGTHGGFLVNCTAHLWAPEGGATGSLSVLGSWDSTASTTRKLTVPAGASSVSLQLQASAEQIRLWWPQGMGEQPMYNVTATWSSGNQEVETTRRMGFRVFALVTGNDTDPAYVENKTADGTELFGLFFRINGAAMYSRGANMIPMDELEGRLEGLAHRYLVRSAAEARMNTLRIWGGGMFLPRAFYDACDDYGLIVYHDMQYAGGAHSPSATATQDQELRFQIRRLSHHPSIMLYDGCNECVVNPGTDTYIYATFVMTVVAQEDQSRAIWPSSPASGWVTGVNRLFSTPNGNSLTTRGGGHAYAQGMEHHQPYQLGSGFPAKNSGWRMADFDDPDRGAAIDMPLKDLAPENYFWTEQGAQNYKKYNFSPAPQVGSEATGHQIYRMGTRGYDVTDLVKVGDLEARDRGYGVQYSNVFFSEFGTTGTSSFESMSATLSPEHWGIHGGADPDNCTGHPQGEQVCFGENVMAQRNYACDSGIDLVFGNNTLVDRNASGELAFKGQLFQCMLSQAIVMKQNLEMHRSLNHYGTLVWQLNEIWPTNGWGSLEYGNVGFTDGQVRGGRWKPLHYWYRASIYADVMATCGMKQFPHGTEDWVCFVRNDRASAPFSGTVTLTAYDLMGDGQGEEFVKLDVELGDGPGTVQWFSPPNNRMPDASSTVVISTVKDSDGNLMSEHMIHLAYPRFLQTPLATLSMSVAEVPNADGSVDITVSSDKVALFVTLTTRAQGRFSDNSFFLPATSKVLQFIPHGDGLSEQEMKLFKASLRIEDHSMYAGAAEQSTGATWLV